MSSDMSEQSGKLIKLGAAIGVIVLSVVVFFWRSGGERANVLAPAPILPVANEYVMKCKSCRTSFTMPREKFESWERTDEGFKCPKCGSFKTEPDNSKITPMVEVPTGG